MNKSSIKPFLIECGIISESSIKWTNKVQSPNVSSEISDYAADIYFKGFDGESNVKEVNLIVATWLIAQVNKLGGPENIGTKDREKLITIIAYYKLLEDKDDSGATGFLKNDLNETFEFAKERLEEEKEKQERGSDIEEAPITKAEETGLVTRVYSIPDGSGRVWVRVNQEVASKFFDTKCDLGRPLGVGCQSKLHSMTVDFYRSSQALNYSLLGPLKGTKTPVSTLLAMAINKSDGNMQEARQAENKVIGSESFYGWNDYAEQFVIFLGTSEAKNRIHKISGSAASFFNWIFNNKKFDILNRLDIARPDLIENSEEQIKSSGGAVAKEWFETRKLDAVEALKKFGPEEFINRIDGYSKSATFKEALMQLAPSLSEVAKKNPMLILSKVNYLLEFLPVDDFKKIISNINLEDYIKMHKTEFKDILKKLTNVNKDAKAYKDIFKGIVENYFPAMAESFGVGLSGVARLLDFLEMPKSDKHRFIKRTSDGKIIALKKDIQVNPETHERIETDVEFELGDQLSILPQKERRELLKKNENFIKTLIEGDDEKKEINFLKILFGATNSQDVQRTLVKDKEKFINYYDKFNKNETAKIINKIKELKDNNPDFEKNTNLRAQAKKMVDIAKSLTINGIPKPGIMSYYSIFNKGQNPSTAFYKFNLEDLRDPKTFKELKEFYEKVETKKGKKTNENIATIKLNVADDILHLFKLAGASNEEIYQILEDNFNLTSIYGNGPIPPTAYSIFFNILSIYTTKKFAKDQIEKNKEKIISKSSGADYNIVLSKFSMFQYDVKVGEMVEFIGKERADIEKTERYVNYPEQFNNVLGKYFYLDTGRKYKISQVDNSEKVENNDDVMNTKIKVIDNTGKETEWLKTKEFKVSKSLVNESIRRTIRKKLLETYFKNKK